MKKYDDIEFPECWEEVQPAEFVQLLWYRHQLSVVPGVSMTDIRRAWAADILRLRCPKLPKGHAFMLLVDALSRTLDWAMHYDDEQDAVVFTVETTVNLLPVCGLLYGPQSHGADLTFGEFRHAVTAFNRYTTDHNEIDLLALCGILYRGQPIEVNDDQRPPFNPKRLNHYISEARQIPDYVQWGIYALFAYFCQYLQTGAFIVDGSEVCFASIFTKAAGDDGPRAGQSLGLNSILYSVAESGVFGDANATDDTPLLQVLMKLLDDKLRADDLLARAKNRQS